MPGAKRATPSFVNLEGLIKILTENYFPFGLNEDPYRSNENIQQDIVHMTECPFNDTFLTSDDGSPQANKGLAGNCKKGSMKSWVVAVDSRK